MLTSVSLRHTEKHTERNPNYAEVIHRDWSQASFLQPLRTERVAFSGAGRDMRQHDDVCGTSLRQVWGKGVRHLHTYQPDSGGGALPARPQRRLMQKEAFLISKMTNLQLKFCIVFVLVGHFGPPTESLGQQCSRGRELHLEVEKKTDRAKRQDSKKWDQMKRSRLNTVITVILHVFIYIYFF